MNTVRGNALFLVLIAVALFAALSYAVTQSGRGGGSVDRETDLLKASQVIQIIGNVRSGIARLRAVGCSLEEISFYSDDYSSPSSFDNANSLFASGDFSCHLFHPAGAGLTYFGEDLDDLICDNGACGSTLMKVSGGFSMQGLGSSNAELMYIVDNTSETFCESINRSVDMVSPPPTDADNPDDGSNWTGSFDDASPEVLGDTDANLAGQDIGCYDRSGSEFVFFAVLAER